ncbi:hypothetical protein [uncultured Gulosibacter sp.]|uniref:hypothetical protein n=1 Tax=uncultured Gulosibacter sp. TaxID=1339167 RepID=UPI002889625B|nr:hypothetical protein [uncultured Gulosibacter sp.]
MDVFESLQQWSSWTFGVSLALIAVVVGCLAAAKNAGVTRAAIGWWVAAVLAFVALAWWLVFRLGLLFQH